MAEKCRKCGKSKPCEVHDFDFRWRCSQSECGKEGIAKTPKAATKGLAKHIKKEHKEAKE